jgi:hypothetical protein
MDKKSENEDIYASSSRMLSIEEKLLAKQRRIDDMAKQSFILKGTD